MITEHLSKNPSSNFDNVFKLPGYKCVEENTGRGVCIFYKDNFDIDVHDHVNKLYKPSLFIQIKSLNKPINLGLVYRSPNNEEKENKKLNYQLQFATNKLKNLTIFGDFNHPTIDWEYNYCKRNEEHPDSVFLFEYTKLNLNQLVTFTTHHKPNCKPSLIDLILTKTPELVNSIKQNPPISKSHHVVITSKIKFPNHNSFVKKNKAEDKVIKPVFDKADYQKINTYLSTIEWEKELSTKNVNESWSFIQDKINYVQQHFVPKKVINTIKYKKRTVSKDDTLHFLLKDKRNMFKLYKKYKTQTNLLNYNQARNRVSYKIKILKQDKENKIAKNIKSNPKAFYQYVASKTSNKEGVSDLMDSNGVLTSDNEKKCHILNSFFSSVFTKEDSDFIPDFKLDKDIDVFLETCQVSIQEMEKAILNLNANKSPGPDNFHPKLLKLSAVSLAKPFKLLFDKTIEEGVIPDDFKIAEVRPIFKKGDKSNPGNYRPVSLTSVVCKLFESFVKNALYNHLIDNDLLSKEQYGFVSGKNTITQLLVTLNDWMFDLDRNMSVDAAYMDFRKAFDSVPHKRLLNKLKGHNIKGPILNWITSFLSNRTQFVKINNSVSEKLDVTSGVPQGSVLGPTLFIYYINDLPNVVDNSSIKIFADDTKVYKAINSENDIKDLQTAIDAMFQWTQKWLLQFNQEKCKVLHLGKNYPKHKYTIGNIDNKTILDETDLEKDLGVLIDTDLNFKSHIKNIVKKASYTCHKILKNFTYKKSNILVPLFKTLVRPILEYANNVWSNGLKKYLTKVENVQRKFTKHIKGLNNVSYEERLKRINLPSLEYRQHRGDMIQVYKIAHKFYDAASTESLFTFANNTRLRGHNYKLIKKSVNKSKYSNFFTNRVVNSWNKLPHDIVNAKSINEFKNKLDNFSKEKQFQINVFI